MRLPTLRDPDVAPVDAAEVVVILATAGLVILLFAGLMLIDGHDIAPGIGPTPTLVIGSVCLIAAVIVKALSAATGKRDDEVRPVRD